MSRPTAPEADESWLTIRVDRAALTHNIKELRKLVAQPTRLLTVVKANAYGHGLLVAAEAFLKGGADVLGVHSWSEARRLRQARLGGDILILGPLLPGEMAKASAAKVDVTIASVAALNWAAAADAPLRIHLKVDTGVNRQGVVEAELPAVLELLDNNPKLELVGLSSHFADIEDTTNHDFAREQMNRFEGYAERLRQRGVAPALVHMTCSAATLLWPRSHGGMARVGIAAYGLWPSRETLVSFRAGGKREIQLRPALTWACGVSQVRQVPAGQTVGYGRTWKAVTGSEVAVLPVGYSDGWPRSLGGRAHVLIHGQRAPLVGRICMNLCMADVTRIPGVQAGDEAVLLGRQGSEEITAEMLANQLGTIAYEVITLPGGTWHRTTL